MSASLDDATFALRFDLRQRALKRWMPATELKVLDLGAGEGRLWKKLRGEFKTVEYTPVDKKPVLPGTMPAEANAAFLSGLVLSKFNVVDIEVDSGWESYLTVAMFAKSPLVVFLTHGLGKKSKGFSNELKLAIGLPLSWTKIPTDAKLHDFAIEHCIQKGAAMAGVTEPILSFKPVRGVYGFAVMLKPEKVLDVIRNSA